ncbi:Conserved_hypothetical protein [Hexamita inflata]|uniref:Uncharacterized protein n=1 Tax=Hexamita inflata TaxID=28002 RepID=A0AA86ULF0_9EUKA|nr:Conserved hypothetical protein [Hexamita inflata]
MLLQKMLNIGCELKDLSCNEAEIELAVQISDPIVAVCGLIKKEFGAEEFDEADIEALLKIVRGE